MRLTLAGGVGESSRSCFYMEMEQTGYILDCGTKPGAEEEYPRLSREQTATARWLLLSHSHRDHTGGIPWLVGQGFRGTVLCTEDTFAQSVGLPADPLFVDRLAPPLCWATLAPGFDVMWGRSGHCVGAVWYCVRLDGKKLLFTGDYTEQSSLYACDAIRGAKADVALVDCAYGDDEKTAQEHIRELLNHVAWMLARNRSILMPVPLHGRGIELMLLLSVIFPQTPLYADEALCRQREELRAKGDWLQEQALELLGQLELHPLDEYDPAQQSFCFVADAQMAQEPTQQLYAAAVAKGGVTVLTGAVDAESYARSIMTRDSVRLLRYPVHQSLSEARIMCEDNDFGRVVLVHTDQELSGAALPRHCEPHTTGDVLEL